MVKYKRIKIAEYRATKKGGSQGYYIQAKNIKKAKSMAKKILGKDLGTIKLFKKSRYTYILDKEDEINKKKTKIFN